MIVEDGAWMRKKDDNAHINLSELDLKDVNMALKWSVLDINIKTDSATRRAKLGQIQGGGLQRASQDSTKWGVAIIYYFLRVKNITF